MPKDETAVVGGGVAAYATALQLALHGRDVSVFAATSPRPDFPRTLPVPALALFKALSLTDAALAECLLARTTAQTAWETAAFVAAPHASYLVDVARLSEALRARAYELGVRFAECDETLALSRSASGWHVETRREARDARFLVIADPRFASSECRLDGEPTHALVARWRGRPGAAARLLVEATPEGWCWLMDAPNGDQYFLALHDPALDQPLPQQLERLSSHAVGMRELLPRELPQLSSLDASTFSHSPVVGDDYALVGSASATLDPLSSQGLVAAAVGAAQVAAVVSTILLRPEHADAARSFYTARVTERRSAHAELTAAFHAKAGERFTTPFWSRRRRARPVAPARVSRPPAPGGPLMLSSDAAIVDVPTLASQLIVPRPALVHESLSRPLAFLGGRPIRDLVDDVVSGVATDTVVDWLWQRGIVTSPSTDS
jgi:2-polyprenyl-6-methoxyphenol hydroxylase-like FAD-dependent oxidoreductase